MPSGASKHGSIPTSPCFFSSYPWHLEILYPVFSTFPSKSLLLHVASIPSVPNECTTYDTSAIMAYPALMESFCTKTINNILCSGIA